VNAGVLVTGAHGLLGSWLVGALLERGERVVVLSRGPAPASALALEGFEERCTVVQGDVLDGDVVDRVVGEQAVGTVFHLAAQPIAGTAFVSPAATLDANVRGTWMVLEACRAHAVGQVVVAGSQTVYGPGGDQPQREDHCLRPRSPYDASKAAADLVARSYAHSYGMRVAVTRFANTYGEGDRQASRLVTGAVAAALAGRDPVVRSDGSPVRDFLYVHDAVSAYLAIADRLREPDGGGASGEAFNAGGPQRRSVLEVVQEVCRAAGNGVSPDVRGAPVGSKELDRQWVDSSKLRDLTGWRPQVGIEDGIERTVSWNRARPEALGETAAAPSRGLG